MTHASAPVSFDSRCDGRKIALEVAAGNAEAGREIGALPDAPVELERRRRSRTSRRRCAPQSSASVLATVIEATRQQLIAILASSALS